MLFRYAGGEVCRRLLQNGFGVWKTKWKGDANWGTINMETAAEAMELGGFSWEVCPMRRGAGTKPPTIGHGFLTWLIHQNPPPAWEYGTRPIFS